MARYESLSGKPLDDDLVATVIIDLCVKELDGRLELADIKDVREEMPS